MCIYSIVSYCNIFDYLAKSLSLENSERECIKRNSIICLLRGSSSLAVIETIKHRAPAAMYGLVPNLLPFKIYGDIQNDSNDLNPSVKSMNMSGQLRVHT